MDNSSKTSIKEQILAPFLFNKNDILEADFGIFLEALILQNHYFVNSYLLQEAPKLIEVFGLDQLKELLHTNCTSFCVDFLNVVPRYDGKQSEKQPNEIYKFEFVKISKGRVIDEIERILWSQCSTYREVENILSVFEPYLLFYSDVAKNDLYENFVNDLLQNQFYLPILIKEQTELILKAHLDIGQFRINITKTNEDPYSVVVDTNIENLVNAKRSILRTIIELAIMESLELLTALIVMKHLNSQVMFNDSQFKFFDAKLKILYDSMNPKINHENLNRIIKIKNFPDLHYAAQNKSIDIAKIIELREDRDCQNFRDWVGKTTKLTDKELEERLINIKKIIPNYIQSPIGKIIRFGITTGLGTIPVVGPTISIAASAIDSLFIDNILKADSIISFLDNRFRRIYKRDNLA